MSKFQTLHAPFSECWLVVYTQPNAEKKVADRLNLLGHTVYVPMRKEVRQWSDRKKKVQVPLIKSVVFVKNDIGNMDLLYEVPSVRFILKRHRKAELVRPYEIENIKILLQEEEGVFDRISLLEFQQGDWVQVMKGPFKGMQGTTIEQAGKHRLMIYIEGLGEGFSIQIPKSHLKKLSTQAA